MTLYTDSLVHDDVSPVDAPRHAAITSGIYLSRFPFLSKLDLHVEGGSSDITPRAEGGKYYYYEGVYRDCYLNKRDLLGSWLGREGTGDKPGRLTGSILRVPSRWGIAPSGCPAFRPSRRRPASWLW